jgi:hypothetical protein
MDKPAHGEPKTRFRPFEWRRIQVGEVELFPSTAATDPRADPIRATLLAVLRQLNQTEAHHEGNEQDQALELAEIEQRLSDFWAVKQGKIKVPLAVGLLLRNKMVETRADPKESWQRQRSVQQRYQITVEGKRFLTEALTTETRIK